MIHIIRGRATSQQMKERLEMLETYVKLAVDISEEFWLAVGPCTQTVRQYGWRMAANKNLSGARIGILLNK